MNLNKRISRAALKYLFNYLSKKFALGFLSGPWGGLLLTILTPILARILNHTRFKIQEKYLVYASRKDKNEYLEIEKENKTVDVSKMSLEEKKKLQESYLNKLSKVLSVKGYFKK